MFIEAGSPEIVGKCLRTRHYHSTYVQKTERTVWRPSNHAKLLTIKQNANFGCRRRDKKIPPIFLFTRALNK